MRQNTTSPRACLPFQCFHTCAAPGSSNSNAVLFVRGANHVRLDIKLATFPQHEIVVTPMDYTGSSSGIHRFSAAINIDSGANLQRYAFKISLLDDRKQIIDVVWYSSLGMSRERPLLQHCFAYELFNTHPTWALDLILYQIMPDKFASSRGYFSVDGTRVDADAPVKPRQLEMVDLNEAHCGGDLDGIGDMLPYIRRLGCDGLYLTPIFKSGSAHKYDTEDYDMVDPHFGGNGALKRLRMLSLGYDVKLLLHGTFNHTGDNHPWFDRQERTGKGALRHKDSPYRELYTFNSDGEAYYSGDRPSCPKLDYSNYQTRHALFEGENSVVRKWSRPPYGIDGWIIDEASQIGDNGNARNNVKRLQQICEAARSTHIDALMIGNFRSDARYAICRSGNVDGSINYTGFLSPIRAFFGGVNLNGEPIPYTGEDLKRTCEEYAVGVSQQVKLCMINQLDNDTLPRFHSVIDGDRSLYLAALAALYTWRGIPCVYQGDELGDVLDRFEIGPRSLIPFKALQARHASPVSSEIQQVITELASMRRGNPALTRGSMIFINAGGAHFAYIRLFDNRFSIVFVNASRAQVKIEQGSMLFPLLAAIYLPEYCHEDDSEDSGESLLIPLSGRNVRRVDHGEGLEALYEMLSREKMSVSSYGANHGSAEFSQKFLRELTSGKTITMPARSTVIVNNVIEKSRPSESIGH